MIVYGIIIKVSGAIELELYNKELLKNLKDEIGETNYYIPKKLFENVMFRNIRLETKLAYVAILDVLLKKPTYNQENKALLKVDNPMIVKTLAILANKEVDQNKINKYLDELMEANLIEMNKQDIFVYCLS